MTELEKIEYAKSFIDKLANGINPLDDTPIPEDDIANHVRLSRCFFYVSSILQKEIDREQRKAPKEKKTKKLPFSITQEQLQQFEYSPSPISVSAMGKKINWLVREEIEEKRMEKFSYRKINYWLREIGMIEWREWDNGKSKRFPTPEGEEIGLVLQIWENYGRISPVIYLSEEAQHFIIDHIEAVMAAEKGSLSPLLEEEGEEAMAGEASEGKPKPYKRKHPPFSITQEQLEKFEYSSEPIAVSEIAKRLYTAVGNEMTKRVSSRQINQWLLDAGLLALQDLGEQKPVKRPTEEGQKVGITVETRMGLKGEYRVLLYNADAQRLILDNLEAILATEVKKSKYAEMKQARSSDRQENIPKDRDRSFAVSMPTFEEEPEAEQRLCRNCRFQLSGECSSWEICDDFQPIYRVSRSEMENWPTEGDATRFKQKWKKGDRSTSM